MKFPKAKSHSWCLAAFKGPRGRKKEEEEKKNVVAVTTN